jgi:hypothetical protein
MHNLPIPPSDVISQNSGFMRKFFGKLKEAFAPMEDQWTWTTQDGKMFEDVDVETVQNGDVIFRHKFGKTRLPIATLSEDSRKTLEAGLQAAEASAAEEAKKGKPGKVLYPSSPGQLASEA